MCNSEYRFTNMFRPSFRALKQAQSAASGTGSSGFRGSAGRLAALGAVALTSAYAAYTLKLSQHEEVHGDVATLDVRPDKLWTPPTREQMIEALKRSSSNILRSDGDAAQRSLLRQQHEAVGVAPSPEVAQVYPAESNDEEGFDLLVVGGGATGAGIAMDAATRGLKVAIVERDDYSAGTSSKSTKLVHGGVRYLQKAVMQLDYEQYKMVREALAERKTFLHTAPYLSNPLPIMIPAYSWWKLPYYFAGTKLYDIIAGSENMYSSYIMTRSKALEAFPMLRTKGLAGAVVYYDGQQNDSRMNVALVLSAIMHGAVAANHTEVVALNKAGPNSQISGARLRDRLSGDEFDVRAKVVINATGPFCDSIRKMDDPSQPDIVAPSSGVHITFPGYFSPRHMGLLDPATSDGRVIFFLPWQGSTIAGTTDTAAKVEPHPIPGEREIQWILEEVRNYLNDDVKVTRSDVQSAWSGLRPLVKDPAAKDTQSLVRNHMINISDSGLLTISGGKWTTYREMAEQTVDRAVEHFGLKPVRPCVTRHVRLIGSHDWSPTMYVRLLQEYGLDTDVAHHLSTTYGDRAWSVCEIIEATGKRYPRHGVRLDAHLPYIEAEVRYATRMEYATKIADFIGRRSRMSFLNTEATIEALPRVIDIMGEELNWNESRRQLEFEEGIAFLASMGVHPDRLKQISNIPLSEARRWKDTRIHTETQ
ncbi:glycerol-3-phosphate dehydrogenase [Malassezia cuniculi]|uniref:Glycerol-3-phosphate dehydrogenase n=1 Tax=Malassezia cuniculi TaxID=948313 RepID=A0AAF0J668_9BASI|nr:glycerol-3-phosphate dehydrogenase [Malassezia cuniculi]